MLRKKEPEHNMENSFSLINKNNSINKMEFLMSLIFLHLLMCISRVFTECKCKICDCCVQYI